MHLKTSSAKWWPFCLGLNVLTHWGRVTHICVDELTIIGSDNSLSPGRRQAIIWTNAGILLIEPLRTNFSEISIAIHTFPYKEIHLKMSSGKWRPFCLGLNVLTRWGLDKIVDILHTFSNAFSGKKPFMFWFKFRKSFRYHSGYGFSQGYAEAAFWGHLAHWNQECPQLFWL